MTKQLLIIGFVWPEPDSSAAGSRMLQIIEQFQNQGYGIVFASAAKISDKTYNLNAINVETREIQLNDSTFDAFVAELNPDVVVFDRFMIEEQYGWRVAEYCPHALRILDTEDFHGLRKAREQALKANTELSVELLQNDTTKREIASIYRSDLSVMISEAEIDILRNQFRIDDSLLHYLPFLLDKITEENINHLPAFEERQHFMTIGNFLHPPNYDNVLYLKQTIWPLIKAKLPKAELHIYGAYESQQVTQLHNDKDGFLIKGFADNVNEVMQHYRVCLAPLRFGAGLKGKLIDAMQNGTPCMMSTIASEGMFGELEPNGFVIDDVKAFATNAVSLYTDASVWNTKQANGFKVINDRFNTFQFNEGFAEKVSNLRRTLKTHRENNFIGNMLQHQTLQSTKYLSKWIEEKNK
ncbi:MAG: glycosyltransferase family 4 protein [Winogradskyella sp.]